MTELPGALGTGWWLCPKGHALPSIYNNLRRPDRGCKYCRGRWRQTEDDMRALAAEKGLEYIGGFKDTHTNCTWRCPKHNHIQQSRPYVIKRSLGGCSKCGRERTSAAQRMSLEEVLSKLPPGAPEYVSGYVAVQQKCVWRCQKHGEFTTTAQHIIEGHRDMKCGAVARWKKRAIDYVEPEVIREYVRERNMTGDQYKELAKAKKLPPRFPANPSHQFDRPWSWFSGRTAWARPAA